MIYSTALTSNVHQQALGHLLREDGQEDLCFALWYPSSGSERTTALIKEIILPRQGERSIHGNASFSPSYFERALGIAVAHRAGLAFMHSHISPGWHNMSRDDTNAEFGHAPSVKGATGLPFVGLTLGTDGSWSARFWQKTQHHSYERLWCETVRVVGESLIVTYADHLKPIPKFRKELERTVSAWGDRKQADLARLKVGIVGVGSVGQVVAESLSRMGIADIRLVDFDSIELINLDRSLLATRDDVRDGKSKVELVADVISKHATSERFSAKKIEFSVVEEEGFKKALDCDVLFSCVDRPWPRSVMNLIAYAHLIPVIDGGITVKVNNRHSMLGADWKAHIAGPSRECLECLGQYDPGLVSAEREGKLDDPTYISSLPYEHPVKRNENVFAFSVSVASLQILQFLSMIISPLGISDIGKQNYHFVTGRMDVEENGKCEKKCPYTNIIALGNHCGYVVIGKHQKAENARLLRASKSMRSRESFLKKWMCLLKFW